MMSNCQLPLTFHQAKKKTSKSWGKKTEGYKFLINEFQRYEIDPRAGINCLETDKKTIELFFDRTPELHPYSRNYFAKNFGTTARDYITEKNKLNQRAISFSSPSHSVLSARKSEFFYF